MLSHLKLAENFKTKPRPILSVTILMNLMVRMTMTVKAIKSVLTLIVASFVSFKRIISLCDDDTQNACNGYIGSNGHIGLEIPISSGMAVTSISFTIFLYWFLWQ